MDGILMEMNPYGIHNLGYEKDEIIGKPLQSIVSPEFLKGFPERIRKINEEGSGIIESAYVRKNGTVIPVEVNIRVVEKDSQKFHFSLARDITERKKELENMQNREAISRAVIERILDS
jgi:PAS domain S-box-containing protein